MANRYRSLVLLAALGVSAVVAAPSAADDAAPPTDPAPPVVVSGDGAESDGDGAVERSRAVDVGDLDAALAGASDGTVALDLFDDTSVVVELTPSPSGVDGWQAWTGRVAGDADSSVVLTSDGTSTGGVVTSTEGTFEIRATADGHVVTQVDQAAFPDDSQTDTVPGSEAPTAEAGSLPSPQPDAGVRRRRRPRLPRARRPGRLHARGRHLGRRRIGLHHASSPRPSPPPTPPSPRRTSPARSAWPAPTPSAAPRRSSGRPAQASSPSPTAATGWPTASTPPATRPAPT